MALRFVGIDPATSGGNCPSVWVDEDSGDLLIQGWEVTEPAARAEIAAKSPIAGHERIVRLPARMRSIVREACDDNGGHTR